MGTDALHREHVSNDAVARRLQLALTGSLTDASMEKGHGARRGLEGKTCNALVERRWETRMIASVGTPFVAETGLAPVWERRVHRGRVRSDSGWWSVMAARGSRPPKTGLHTSKRSIAVARASAAAPFSLVRGLLGPCEMGSEPALHRRTQRGRWHWQRVVKPPGVGRPLVHLRQHLTERHGHIWHPVAAGGQGNAAAAYPAPRARSRSGGYPRQRRDAPGP
jgi:hypothetical protein